MYRVMIVEDEALFRKSLRKVITNASADYEVVAEAEDGAQALVLIEECKPHLVVTDILMPVMGGMELIRNIKESGRDIDVVILSGHDEFEFAKEAMRYGVEEYLLKPIDVEEVRAVISRIYGKRMGRKEAAAASGRCIIECMGFIGQMAEDIWSLGEEQALKSLDEIFRLVDGPFLNRELVLEEIREILNGRLEEKLKNRPGPGDFLYGPITLDSGRQDMYAYFKSETERIIDLLKQVKNPSHGILVRKVHRYISENYSDSNMSLSSTAAAFSMNESYLSSLFRNETGVTFTDYVTELRINKAKEFIKNGMKTSDAAIAAGYNDYPHFSRTFRRITNMSPTEYREKINQ